MKGKTIARVLAVTALASVLVFGLSGCAGTQPAESDDASAQQEQPAEQLAAAAYREVLADPSGHFELDEDRASDATFTYALVNMAQDPVPQLLVRATGESSAWNGIEVVRVFSYDAQTASLVAPARDIETGVAGVGGFRGGLMYSAYGNGLLRSELSSGTGEGSITRITLEGDDLAETFVAPIDLASDSDIASLANDEGKEISWLEVSDASALDALESGSWQTTAEQVPDMAAAAEEAGLSVYTGTVRILDADGVCELQGQSNPNPGASDGSDYVVLDLGGEQKVTARSGSGSGTVEQAASLLLLDRTGNGRSWKTLDGKKATVAIDASACSWPSDTSLPLGAPRCTGHVAVIG